MRHFVVVYDRRAGTTLALDEYQERRDAFRNLRRLEHAHQLDSNIEIVLLTAESEAAIKRTHGRYFKSYSDLLAG